MGNSVRPGGEGVGPGGTELADLARGELAQPASEAARHLAGEMRQRHGDAVAAVVFYGSCLRKQTSEGVLDFYLIVDAYERVYDARLPAWANAVLPPSVFYVEVDSPEGTLRAKYAVLSLRDFERGASPGGFRTSIWARFCQPARVVYARSAQDREDVVGVCVRAMLTALERLVPLMPGDADSIRFRYEDFWQLAFRETYAAEMRTESPETIRSLYEAAPARYDLAARAGLQELADRKLFSAVAEERGARVDLDEASRRRARRAWSRRRLLAKVVYVGQLLKTAATFGDWLPYVLWKLERHGGRRMVPTERQRRHPLIWGWPLLFKALWRREVR